MAEEKMLPVRQVSCNIDVEERAHTCAGKYGYSSSTRYATSSAVGEKSVPACQRACSRRNERSFAFMHSAAAGLLGLACETRICVLLTSQSSAAMMSESCGSASSAAAIARSRSSTTRAKRAGTSAFSAARFSRSSGATVAAAAAAASSAPPRARCCIVAPAAADTGSASSQQQAAHGTAACRPRECVVDTRYSRTSSVRWASSR
jgi:hypothetical protein